MIFPKEGKFHCVKCNIDIDAGGKVEKFNVKADNNELIVQSANDTVLEKTRVVCPICGFTEATVTVRQTRAADEPETMIYRCCNPKCNHTWREY